jgi:large subunit ribosomal protein L30
MAGTATLRVTQIKSGIGYSVRQKRILRSLGLGKMHRTVELPDNDSVRGMLRAVPHLVRVESEAGDSSPEEA